MSSQVMTEAARKRLTKGVNVLSWDCGTTNLCYCLLEQLPELNEDGTKNTKEFRIVKWQNFSLYVDNIKEAAESLVSELNRRPWMLDVDYVVIEAQVIKNVSMKCLSHIIQTYFRTRATAPVEFVNGTMIQAPVYGPSVHFIEAKSKFSVCAVPEPKLKSRRLRNKRVAVLMAQKLLADQGDHLALQFLSSFDKKDDLSDSFVQALYFLRLLRNRRSNSHTIRNHISQNAVEDGIELDTGFSLNEGCEVDDEIPLPRTYKRETFSDPVYKLDTINASQCYKRVVQQPQWISH